MKTKILLFACLFITGINTISKSQNLAGKYMATGYFFHPSVSRAINLTKS